MSYWIIRLLSRLLVWTHMRLHIDGIEHVPARGPVLLVSNHLGPVDHFAIGVRLPRPMRILAKVEVFEWPVLGWLARRSGAVSIRRGESDREALRRAKVLLDAGECLLVFPEGTYAHPPAPVGLLPMKSGVAWLALHSGAPVVPVAIHGIETVWIPARGWRLGKRPRVSVTFGEPYLPALGDGSVKKGDLAAAANDMALRLAAMLPPAYRGVYASELASHVGATVAQ